MTPKLKHGTNGYLFTYRWLLTNISYLSSSYFSPFFILYIKGLSAAATVDPGVAL